MRGDRRGGEWMGGGGECMRGEAMRQGGRDRGVATLHHNCRTKDIVRVGATDSLGDVSSQT